MKPVLVLAVLASCSHGATPPREVASPPARRVQPASPTSPSLIPDTPAGKVLGEWLAVFDRGDAAGLERFVAKYKPDFTAADMVGFRDRTGGFELVSIQHSSPLQIQFAVKDRRSARMAVGWLRLKEADPSTIRLLTVFLVPRDMTAAQMTIDVDATTRTRVLDAVATKLTELYVFPEVAKQMVDAVREHRSRGTYDAIGDGPTLATLLTTHLQAVSHDRHLGVDFSPRVVPSGDPAPTPEDEAAMREHLKQMNCGFEKAERLDGNIGYVRFVMFGEASVCGPIATAALKSLDGVDALIFDLRDNGGGHPDMVAFVSSYLFAKRTHLNDIYDRKQNKTTKYWTKPEVPGPKFVMQPVFVLTSQRTFSGAEEFSFNLKNLRRATIVGETTGGGAHPTMGHRLDDHFIIRVPFARAINPITKTNWEGKGVEPDVEVPADRALETAKQLAAEQIQQRRKRNR